MKEKYIYFIAPINENMDPVQLVQMGGTFIKYLKKKKRKNFRTKLFGGLFLSSAIDNYLGQKFNGVRCCEWV